MEQIPDALNVTERSRRTLAAEDRIREIRAIYAAYHSYDWEAALLADLLLSGTSLGRGGGGFEMDIARAEHVAGVKVASGRIPRERRWAHSPERPRSLRGTDDEPLPFDYGRWSE